MAEANQAAEELARTMARLNEDMALYGRTTVQSEQARTDAEMKAKADRMYRRICEGLTAEVAEAFGHQASGTEDLERQLREAVVAKDWDRAKRLSGQLAKQGRQAG